MEEEKVKEIIDVLNTIGREGGSSHLGRAVVMLKYLNDNFLYR